MHPNLRRRFDEHVQAVLEERARLLARSIASEPQRSKIWELLTFRLGQERYAVETRFVQKVFRPTEISPVPRTAGFLKGVTNLRGEVLAGMDLSSFLGRAGNGNQAEWVLVFGDDRPEFGLLAETIEEVIQRKDEELFPVRNGPMHASTDLIRGVTADALFVLDGEKLLNDPRLMIDEL